MSAETESVADGTAERGCWCCGRIPAERALIRLANHPEVGVCADCVHFLGRRARDYQATIMHERLRGAAEWIRNEIMARGWHRLPVLGAALRWINRHSPW